MNVAIAFGPWNLDQFNRWHTWASELGGVERHDLFVSPFRGMSYDLSQIKGWRSVTHVPDWYGIESDWQGNETQRSAAGPNASWRCVANSFAENKRGPWLWCESDCIPLTPDWLDRIESEYKRAGSRYMGALVKVEGIPEHMTGNGVYPEDCAHSSVNLMLPRFATIDGKQLEIAFDVAGAPDVLPQAHFTKLIQHRFRAAPITSQEEYDRIVDKEAVLYHSDKTGSVIELLRGKRGGGTPVKLNTHVVAPSGETQLRAASALPTVYTYFSPAPDPKLVEEQKAILAIWEAEWRKSGYDPVILTEHDARKDSMFTKWTEALAKIPTVNPQWYERACWTRWIAMVASNGGLMTDYDVLPNGFTAKDEPPVPHGDYPILLCDGVPCAVYGNKRQYENAITMFTACECDYEDGKPHLSDMHACKKLKFPSVDLTREYGTKGFQDAKLIHFSHASRHGKLRSELMTYWLSPDGLDRGNTVEVKADEPEPDIVEVCENGSTDFGASTAISELHSEPTIVGQMRTHIGRLKTLVGHSVGRKITMQKELRKAGLIPQAKRMKRRKWPGL